MYRIICEIKQVIEKNYKFLILYLILFAAGLSFGLFYEGFSLENYLKEGILKYIDRLFGNSNIFRWLLRRILLNALLISLCFLFSLNGVTVYFSFIIFLYKGFILGEFIRISFKEFDGITASIITTVFSLENLIILIPVALFVTISLDLFNDGCCFVMQKRLSYALNALVLSTIATVFLIIIIKLILTPIFFTL